MKITQLFKIYWPDNGGGIAKAMENIAQSFPDCEQEIIVCQDSRKKKTTDDMYKGIAVHRCRTLWAPVSTPVSIHFLCDVKKRTKNSDIVIYHFPYPMVDLAILFGLYSGKLIVWWHCGFEKYQKLALLYRPLVRHTLKKADQILVSSKGNVSNSMLKPYWKKCRVIPYCVSNEYIKKGQEYVAKEKKAKDGVQILFIGRLVWYKGCDILLKAFAKIQGMGCRLVIVGSGPLEKELKKLAESLELTDVLFTGMLSEDEKMRRIAECDFLVLPSVSRAEAFAIVQLEAMAFGKPVINTALKSGVPYVSIDKVTGRTVRPGNVHELAAAMKELALNETLRWEYGANAIRIVHEIYTQEQMDKKYYKLFRQLVGVKNYENSI